MFVLNSFEYLLQSRTFLFPCLAFFLMDFPDGLLTIQSCRVKRSNQLRAILPSLSSNIPDNMRSVTSLVFGAILCTYGANAARVYDEKEIKYESLAPTLESNPRCPGMEYNAGVIKEAGMSANRYRYKIAPFTASRLVVV